jgi:hypothetical protein
VLQVGNRPVPATRSSDAASAASAMERRIDANVSCATKAIDPACRLQMRQQAENRSASVPGAICRCRSHSSPVAVRRGSITTIFVPRSRRRQQPLEEDRMAPGEVGAHQHDEIRFVEVGIGARHRVGAEGPPVAGDGRGHAEPRIGVDVAGTDEALHQLVGDVIILGQQLAGDVEGDGVRSMLGIVSVKRATRPSAASQVASAPADLRCQQPSVEAHRFAQRHAL